MNNVAIIAATETSQHIDASLPLEDRLRAAMRLTYRHWLATNDEDQFNAAVGAVMLKATPDEQERIKRAMKLLQALGAAMSGVPVDFGSMFEEGEEPPAPLPLLPLWNEVKEVRYHREWRAKKLAGSAKEEKSG